MRRELDKLHYPVYWPQRTLEQAKRLVVEVHWLHLLLELDVHSDSRLQNDKQVDFMRVEGGDGGNPLNLHFPYPYAVISEKHLIDVVEQLLLRYSESEHEFVAQRPQINYIDGGFLGSIEEHLIASRKEVIQDILRLIDPQTQILDAFLSLNYLHDVGEQALFVFGVTNGLSFIVVLQVQRNFDLAEESLSIRGEEVDLEFGGNDDVSVGGNQEVADALLASIFVLLEESSLVLVELQIVEAETVVGGLDCDLERKPFGVGGVADFQLENFEGELVNNLGVFDFREISGDRDQVFDVQKHPGTFRDLLQFESGEGAFGGRKDLLDD